MKKKTSLCFLVVAVLVCSLVLGGCSAKQESASTTAEQEPTEQKPITVKIGCVFPLTGDLADKGAMQRASLSMAIDEINKSGGALNGKYNFELVIEDDGGVPAQSVAAATKLITQDKVHMICGSLTSTCTLAMMDVTESYGLVHLACNSTSPAITERGNKFIFRNTATDSGIVESLVKYAMKEYNAKKFAIIHDTVDFGVGGKTGLERAVEKFKDKGLEIIAVESYTFGDTDMSVQLTKIEAANPDVCLVYGDGPSAYLTVKQYHQMGIKPPLLTGTLGAASPLLDAIGGDADGLIFATPFTPSNPSPKVEEFVKKFSELNGYMPDSNCGTIYDGGYLIKEMMERADSLDPVKMRDAMRSIQGWDEGVAGSVSFNEVGEPQKVNSMVKIEGAGTTKLVGEAYKYLGPAE